MTFHHVPSAASRRDTNTKGKQRRWPARRPGPRTSQSFRRIAGPFISQLGENSTLTTCPPASSTRVRHCLWADCTPIARAARKRANQLTSFWRRRGSNLAGQSGASRVPSRSYTLKCEYISDLVGRLGRCVPGSPVASPRHSECIRDGSQGSETVVRLTSHWEWIESFVLRPTAYGETLLDG